MRLRRTEGIAFIELFSQLSLNFGCKIFFFLLQTVAQFEEYVIRQFNVGAAFFCLFGNNVFNFLIRIHNVVLFFQNNFFIELTDTTIHHFFDDGSRFAGSCRFLGKDRFLILDCRRINAGNIQSNRLSCRNMHGDMLTQISQLSFIGS